MKQLHQRREELSATRESVSNEKQDALDQITAAKSEIANVTKRIRVSRELRELEKTQFDRSEAELLESIDEIEQAIQEINQESSSGESMYEHIEREQMTAIESIEAAIKEISEVERTQHSSPEGSSSGGIAQLLGIMKEKAE